MSDDLNPFLGALLLPEPHPPFKECGISFQEVPHDVDQWYKEDTEVHPCLPELQRACGKKEHQGHGNERSGEPAKDGLSQHGSIFLYYEKLSNFPHIKFYNGFRCSEIVSFHLKQTITVHTLPQPFPPSFMDPFRTTARALHPIREVIPLHKRENKTVRWEEWEIVENDCARVLNYCEV